MNAKIWGRWLTQLFKQAPKRIRRRTRPQSRLNCESLEDRLTPTTYTWTGLGSSPNWSVAANWSSSAGGAAAPSTAAGAIDDLVFGALSTGAGVARPTNNNFAGLIVNSITFSANPTAGSTYTLGGNGITLVGGINVGASLGTETIAMNLTLTPPTATLQQTFTVPSASTLDISGTLTGKEPVTGSTSAATETAEETITKAGSGTLQLDGNNSGFTGAISIASTGGILVVTNSDALGLGQSVSGVATAGTTTINSGTQLQIKAGATPLSIPEQLIINGTGIINDGALLNVNGKNTWTGPITMDTNSTLGANSGTTLTIAGQITDVGAGESITTTGLGTIVFSHVGGNTYRGTTTINNGILEIEDPLSLGAGANSLTVQSGTPQSETIVNYNPITGAAGTLELNFTGTLGTNDPNGILANPNLVFNAKTNPYIGFQVFNDILVLNGPGFTGLGALYNLNGDNAWDGSVALGSPSSVPNTGNVSIGVAATTVANPNTNLTISGVVSSVSPLPNPLANLLKIGGGALILNDTNTFVGSVTIEQGAINVGDSGALGSATTNPVTVFSGAALQLQVDSGLDGTMAGGVLERTHFRNLGFDSVNGSGPGQELDVSGVSGTFTLNITNYTSTGLATSFTSAPVNVASSTFITDLQTAVTNLLNSAGFTATGNVTVTENLAGSGTGNLYRIIFSGVLANANIPLMTASPSSISVNPNGAIASTEQLGITGTSGSFSLSLTKASTTYTSSTVNIASPTFAADLQTSVINLLTSAGFAATATNVTVTETTNGPVNLFSITFSGSLASVTIPLMSPSITSVMVNAIYGLTITNSINLNGTGLATDPDGALDSISGLNTYTGPITLGGLASVGVDADTRAGHPLADSNYLTNDYSLTIKGNGITSGIVSGAGTFDKFGLGDLILPTANNYISANDIKAGWVTVENNQSLGVQQNLTQTLQSYTTVESGAAVMLDPQSSFLALANNFALSGDGITPSTKSPAVPNVFGLINQDGAIENLNGNNILTGIIKLNGNAGIGVEQVFTPTPGSTPTSQLTLTGTLEDGTSSGGITKLGSRRLIIEGPGTYTGNVNIADGVLLLQNSTGLGEGNVASPPTVTVQSGAALEIGNTTTALEFQNSLGGATYTSSLSGGIQEGLEVWGEHLILNGSGDPTFGDTALTILSSNAPTTGPEVQTVAVGPTGSFTLTYGGQTTTALSTAASAATVQAALDNLTSISDFQGAFATVIQSGNVYLITITNPDNPGQVVTAATVVPALTGNGADVVVNTTQSGSTSETLAPVNDPLVSTDNIWQGPVSLNSNTIITVPANSRLIIGGNINNGTNTPSSGYGGSSLTLMGGGELDLDGNNSYSGTTFIDQGVLTAGSSTALGTTGVPEIQTVTLTGATAGSTKFILTFTSLSGVVTPTAAITYTGIAATDEANITAALNALSTIGGGTDVGGSVTVTEIIAPGTVTITIKLGGTLSGFPQNLLNASVLTGSGTAAVSALTAQTVGTGGTIVANGASLQLAGSVTIAGEPLIIQGDGSLQDTQTVSVTATSGTFSLSFTGPDTTGNVVTDTTATPLNVASGTLASDIQKALQSLGNIGGVNGTVSVVANDTQTLTFAPGSTGTFTLSFTGPNSTGTTVTDTTSALNLSSLTLPSDIQLALNNFTNIAGVGGNVTVTETSSGAFTIVFGGTFSGHAVPTLTVIDNTQTLTFAPGSTGTFTLSFTGPDSTGTTVTDTTPALNFSSLTLASDIQTALNNFTNIGGVGGNVTVTETPTGAFTIVFGGTLTGQVVQTLATSNGSVSTGVATVAQMGTTYVVTFGGTMGGTALQTMTVTGSQLAGGTVTPLTTQVGDSAVQNIPTQWFQVGPTTITGGQTAGKQAVAGSVTAIAVDPDDPNVIYIATAGGGVWKTINGGANWYPVFDSIPEIQTITVTTGGSFTLGFGGDITTTLSGKDTNLALDIQSALDALGSIGGAGGQVTVFQSASILDVQTLKVTATGGTFTLSYTGPDATGTTVTDNTAVLNVASTTLASDIQNALEALGNIGGVGGTVSVTQTGTSFAITFGGTLSGQGLQTMVVHTVSPFSGGTVTNTITQGGETSYQVTFGGQLAGLSEPLISTNIINGSIAITELEAGANPLFAMYVGAIAINPNNPNVVYVGTGVTNNSADSFYGTGIYESTNAGITWSLMSNNTSTNPSVVANPFYGRGISSMVVDPVTNDLIVADGDSTQGQDEVQTLTFIGDPDGFTLSLTAANSNGVLVTDTTPAIALNTPLLPIEIQTDLDALSNIGGVGGYVVVSPSGFGGVSITFEGFLSDTTLDALVTNYPLPNSPPPPAIGVQVSAVSGPTTVVNGTTGGSGSGPGIWRFTPNGGTSSKGIWENLTDVTSVPRASIASANSKDPIYGPGGTMAGEPDTPGPDDNYQVFFPQTNATWTDVQIVTNSDGQQILYAALGSSSIGTTSLPVGTPANGVFWSTNFNGSLANVDWYQGNPWAGNPLVYTVDNELTMFPSPYYVGSSSGKAPEDGNIKISAVTGGASSAVPGFGPFGSGNLGFATIYASVSTPGGVLANIYVSTNGGISWAAVAALPSPVYMSDEGQYDNAILAVNDSTVYVGGQVASGNITGQTGQIYMTTNSGASWTDISVLSGSGPADGQHAIVQDDGNGVLFGNDGGIWLLNSTNTKWSDANGDLANSEVNSVATSPIDITGIATNPATITAVAGIQSNGTAGFDEGQTWAELDDSAGGEMSGDQVFIDPTNPNIIYEVQSQTGAAGPSGSGAIVRESNNDGVSWNTILSYPTITSATIALEMDEINPERLVVGGGVLTSNQFNAGVDSGLYVTLNATANNPVWTNIAVNNNTGAPTLPITVSAIGLAEYQGTFTTDPSFSDVSDQGANAYVPNTIYVTNGTQVYLTKDGGLTWVERDTGLPGNIVQLVVDPRDMDTVYAVTNGFGDGGVWVSFNAGQKWSQIGTNNGLPNVPAWSLVIDPRNNNLYVGTDTGVYELPSGGLNGSGTWQVFGTGMPNVQVHDLVLNPTTNTLLAATYGRGVFELILDNAETVSTSTTSTTSSPVSTSAGTGLSGPSVWSGPVILAGNVALGADGAQNLPNGISTGSINFVGQISDMVAGSNVTIDKVGGGDVIFSGTNTYSGLTDVQQGNLVVDNNQALGADSTGVADGTIVEVGAALELESDLGAEVVTLNGDGSSFNDHFTGALRNIAGDNTYTGNVIFGNNDPNSTFTIGADSGSELTMTGTITGGTAGSALIKEGTGTIALDNENPNTYSGSTAVYQGALQAETSTAFSSGSVEVLDGAQVQLQNTHDVQTLAVTATSGSFSLSFTGLNSSNVMVTDTTTLLDVTSGTLIDDIEAALDALMNIGGVGGSVIVTQPSPGVFMVAFEGALFGDNEQTLVVNNAPTDPLVGGTVTPSVVPVNVPNALNLSGTGIFGTGAILNAGGNNTWSGNITLGLFPGFSPNTLPSGDVAIGVSTGATLTLSGQITDLHEEGQTDSGFQPLVDQESGLNKVGLGTVVLQNPHGTPNDFSGGVTVTQGILVAGDSGALGAHPTIDPTLGTVQQIVTLSNEQTGTFQLSFDGATTTMSYGTTAADMEAKLTSLIPPLGLFASAGIVGADISVVETPIETTSQSLLTSSVPAGNLYTITFGGSLLDTAIPLSATGSGGTVAGASFVTLGGNDILVDSGAELDLNNSNTPSNAIDVVGHTIALNGSGVSGNGALQNTVGDNTWDGVVFVQTGPTSSGTTNTQPIYNSSIGATSGTSLTLAGTLNTAVIDSVPVLLTVGGAGSGGAGTVIFPVGTSFLEHTTITGGNVQDDGTLGAVELVGGAAAISGTGNVGQINDSGSSGGIVNPGENGDTTLVGTNLTFPSESNNPNTNTPGTLTSTGVTLSKVDTYNVYFGDPATPNSSDLLQVNGAIALNGATLSGYINPNVQVGSAITIIQTDYDGGLHPNDVVTGTFVDQSQSGSTPTDPGAGILATTTAFIDNEKFLVDYYIDHVVITRTLETVTLSPLTVTVPPGAPAAPVYGEDVKLNVTLIPESSAVVLTGSTVLFQVIDPFGNVLQFNETVTLVSPNVYGATIDLPESLDGPLAETTNPAISGYTVSVLYDGQLSNGAQLFAPVSDGTVQGQSATEVHGPATVSVTPANTTTTLSLSPVVSGATYSYGTQLTFTATVTSTLPVGDQPTLPSPDLQVLPPGLTVAFYDNQSGTQTLLGFGTLSTSPSGVTTATLTTSTLQVGVHAITAVYEANGIPANYNTSNSNATPISLQVTQAANTLSLAANPATIDYNGQITFTATVTPPAGNLGLPTGTVTFQLGNTVLGTGTLFTVGGVTTATYTTSAFQIPAALNTLQTITASYPGDANFGASSATTQVTVNPIGTTTPPATNTLTSSLNPSSAGQPVTFTDTIGLLPSEVGGANPTGTVVFQITNGTQTIMGSGTVSTVFGLTTATFTTTQMPAGTETVTATYSGDSNYVGGSSAPITQTVTAAVTTTTLIATPTPPAKAVASQAVVLSATVTAPGGGVAFGTVTFTDNTTGKSLGSATLDANGVGTILAVLGTPLTTHSITASFVANDSFQASSGNATVIVAANGVRVSRVTLASSLNPSVSGQTVTFTATVKDAGVGAAQIPTGSVTFKDSTTGVVLGYGVLSTSGGVTKATLATSNFTLGNNSIVAVYTGSTLFAVSSSAALVQVVHGNRSSSVTVSSSINPSSYGQAVKFTATVQDTSGLTPIDTPTGTVSFVITNTTTGISYKGTGTLTKVTGTTGEATASFTTTATTLLPVGTYTVTATYNGDVNFILGNFGTLTQTVNPATTTTTIVETKSTTVYGQAVTFTATVAPQFATGAPTGSVTFYANGVPVATVNVTTKAGKTTAAFTTRTLVPDTYGIDAVYNGNANSQTSTSGTLALTVNQDTPTVALGASTTSSNTSVTFTATVTATLPGSGSPTGTVTFIVDGVSEGTSNLNALDKATLTLPGGLLVGNHTIEAVYNGDTDFAFNSRTVVIDFVVGRGT